MDSLRSMIKDCIDGFATKGVVFSNEAQFQFALAWNLKEKLTEIKIKNFEILLEHLVICEDKKYYIDILVRVGEDLFPTFLKVKRADIGGQNQEVQARKFIYMDEVEAIYHRILERGDCLSLKTLAVTGDDLIAAGIPRGKRIGEILGMLFDRVLKDPSANEKDVLLAMALEKEV